MCSYVLLHHVMGEASGKEGVWSYVKGGMGALSGAIAQAAVQRGAELQTNATVSEIMYEELPLGRVGSPTHKATGVRMEDGTELLADTVISNSTPYVVVARPATCTPHSLLWWRVVGITRSWSFYLA